MTSPSEPETYMEQGMEKYYQVLLGEIDARLLSIFGAVGIPRAEAFRMILLDRQMDMLNRQLSELLDMMTRKPDGEEWKPDDEGDQAT